MHIEKFYFTLPEVLERWSMSEADLVYLAENDVLRLSVRVYDLPIKYRPANAGTSRRPRPRRQHVAGLLDLHAEDVFNLFRCGEINAYEFRCPKLGDVDLPTVNGGAILGHGSGGVVWSRAA